MCVDMMEQKGGDGFNYGRLGLPHQKSMRCFTLYFGGTCICEPFHSGPEKNELVPALQAAGVDPMVTLRYEWTTAVASRAVRK